MTDPVLYSYGNFIVIDSNGNQVRNAVGNLYTIDDTAFVTPVSVTDLSGNTLTDIATDAKGYVAQQFQSDQSRLLWKNGDNPPIEIGSPQYYAQTAQDAVTAAQAAQAAAESATAPTEATVRTVITTDLADPETEVATAVTGIADAVVAPITPDNSVRAVGKGELVVRLRDQVAPSGGDDTAALQTFLNGLADGTEVLIDKGTSWSFSTLTVAANNVTLRLRHGSNLTTTSATTDAITVTGTGVTIKGRGSITSPAAFDSTTSGSAAWAVVHVKADNCKIKDITLVNVPKVGVYFDDTNTIDVEGVKITGNFPQASYTGSNTTHFGIAFNPGSSATGCGKIAGSSISSCIQGVFIGNFGAGHGSGLAITGCTFSSCWNHGIYQDTGVDAVTIAGNTFTECQVAIVATGTGHSITANPITCAGSTQPVGGISLRDGINCTISANPITITGPVGSIAISLDNPNVLTTISGVVVAGNTIDMGTIASVAIRAGNSAKTTTLTDTLITGNIVRSGGVVNLGVIQFSPKAAAVTYGCKIAHNEVVVRGQSHGIFAQNTSHCHVHGNTIRFEYNAAASVTLAAIKLDSCTFCKVSASDIFNTPTFGTNVNLRGIWESTSGGSNVYENNSYDPSGSIVPSTQLVVLNGSNAILDERGTGVPAYFCSPGSRWARLDGGASTSLYVKETASTSTTWAAK